MMQAMVLDSAQTPLRETTLPRPKLGEGQILVRVCACAVCRTDLQVADGELPNPKLPLILGHEVVGRVIEAGKCAERFKAGDRVGIPWLGWTCGECRYCRSGRENLCEKAKFNGYTLDGGYAEYMATDERFCFSIPKAIRMCMPHHFCAPGSSVIDHWSKRVMRSDWAFTVLERRRTLSARLPSIRGARFLLSHGPATIKLKSLPCLWGRLGGRFKDTAAGTT